MYDADAGLAMPRVDVLAAERTFVARVFRWMGVGLLLTGIVAWWVGSDPARFASIFGGRMGLFWALVIGEVVLVMAIQGAVTRASATAASTMFVVYSVLNGLTLSVLFMVYTQASIASTFLASGVTFAVAAGYGATTKKDLSGYGSLCMMGLVGIIVASLLNLVFRSPGVSWAISFVGVIVFVGLAAWDMQKIKAIHRHGVEGGREDKALAIQGALALYLDFINLFIMMLRLFGKRR